MVIEKHSKPRRGFTLIELLVVIAIIGLLASVVLASLNSARERARNASYIAQIKEYQKAVELYYSDNGTYPGGSGWACIGTGHAGSGCWTAGSSGATYGEGYSPSVTFRNHVSPYIDSTKTAGPLSGPFKGAMYRLPSANQYTFLIMLEGDIDCPLGTKIVSSTYSSVNMTRCEYTSGG